MINQGISTSDRLTTAAMYTIFLYLLDGLDLSRGDVEPLGDGRINGGSRLPGVGRQAGVGGVVPGNESRGVLDGDVAAVDGEYTR